MAKLELRTFLDDVRQRCETPIVGSSFAQASQAMQGAAQSLGQQNQGQALGLQQQAIAALQGTAAQAAGALGQGTGQAMGQGARRIWEGGDFQSERCHIVILYPCLPNSPEHEVWSMKDESSCQKPAKSPPGRGTTGPHEPPLTNSEFENGREGIPDTLTIRRRLKMTQEEFAAAFGLSLRSVRDWEQGRHAPGTSTLSYLRMIALRPEEILRIRTEAGLVESSP